MKDMLSTKLYIPNLNTNLIVRKKLIEKLNKGLNGKIIMVCAPAGFGKTTIVSQWLQTISEKAAWFSLDENDNDIVQFMMCMINSLKRISCHFGERLTNIINSKQITKETITTILINEISKLEKDFVFVFDDYHLIKSEKINDFIDFLLKHIPYQMKVVIITRNEPQLNLSKFRLKLELAEIGIEDLRFDLEEAMDFFTNVMELKLEAEEIDILEKRNEGWIAGLQLSALSLQKCTDKSKFISDFSGNDKFIEDYLIKEVLKNKDDTIKKFLFNTSILKKFCASLCDAVLADSDISSQQILEELEKNNTFIISLDNNRIWYRYHHLFRDLLKKQSQDKYGVLAKVNTVPLKEMHKRAATWFEENSFYLEAFQHSICGEDYSRAAKLLEVKLICSIMDSGITELTKLSEIVQTQTWIEMFKLLPGEETSLRPVLQSKFIWALLFHGSLENINIHIENLENLLKNINQKDFKGKYIVDNLGELQFLESTIASARGYIALTTQKIPVCLKNLLEALKNLSNENYLRRGGLECLIGLSYWGVGNLADAIKFLESGAKHLMRSKNYVGAVLCFTIAIELMIIKGELNEALDVCEKYLNFSFEKGEFLQLLVSFLYLEMFKIKLEQGHLIEAKRDLDLSKQYGIKISISDWKPTWYISNAKYLMSIYKFDSALAELEKAENLYHLTPVPDVEPIEFIKVRIWIKQNDEKKLLSWLKRTIVSLDDDLNYILEFAHITLLKVYIYLYINSKLNINVGKIELFLEKMLLKAEIEKRIKSRLELLIIKAVLYDHLELKEEVYSTLEEAFRLAEKHTYVQIFKDEVNSLANILFDYSKKFKLKKYAKNLLNMIDVKNNYYNKNLGNIIENLSSREVEVLKLVEKGLSNKEISEKLFLALSTIKGHNQKVFSKLGVKNRTEAVAKARELKWI